MSKAMKPSTGERAVGLSTPVIFSASEEYLESAKQELRDEYGASARIERVGPDLGAVSVPGVGVAELAVTCRSRPLVFIQHLTAEMLRLPVAEAHELDQVAQAALEVLDGQRVGKELALQTWVTGSSSVGYGAGRLHLRVAESLSQHGYEVSRAGRDDVLSICITPQGVLIALAKAEESLSDWPGGRVRLSRGDGLVSRAEFKLEELFMVTDLKLPEQGVVLDLGASPGGWTRILRQRGLTVWAVDPADLDERVSADPGVRHARTTAGQFFRESSRRFDLVVNDMRMVPLRSCEVMLDAAGHLRPGALAVVTLKISDRRPVELVRACLAKLRSSYDIVFARQLQHNRHEVTVVGRARSRAGPPHSRRRRG